MVSYKYPTFPIHLKSQVLTGPAPAPGGGGQSWGWTADNSEASEPRLQVPSPQPVLRTRALADAGSPKSQPTAALPVPGAAPLQLCQLRVSFKAEDRGRAQPTAHDTHLKDGASAVLVLALLLTRAPGGPTGA